MRRLAAFGGTFDPVHEGHLQAARRAATVLSLDLVVFIPAGCPPHKAGEAISSYCHRFAMLALATRHDDRFVVSELERDATAPSYTVATLQRLRADFTGERIFFLLGSDAFAQITTWHRWRELPDLATLVVLHRPGAAIAGGDPLGPPEFRERLVPAAALRGGEGEVPKGGIVLLDNEGLDVSASELRRRLRHGERAPALLDPAVAAYAVKHGLYHEKERDGR